MNGINKVIGIGLPKTATSSLKDSLNANNIPTIHFGQPECDEIRKKMYDGIYEFEILNKYKGITNAFEMIFPQIDKVYPNSKFIYTIRNKDEWLISVEKHFKRYPARPKHHLITFAAFKFNKDRFSFVYDMHADMVKNYFSDRKDDLLIIDITKDVNYVYKVCEFLNTIVIDPTPFHSNKGG